ncbi:MAG: four helix bundle protein [Pirellulales bacterium]
MSYSAEQFKLRTKKFALRVIRLFDSLPKQAACQTIGRQLLRSGTSVGANYRAACRARSDAEFRSKMGIVEEESDESIYWMELLIEAEYVQQDLLDDLMTEANEILAMTVQSIKTSRNPN